MKQHDNIPQERLWNANYLRTWVANFMIFFSFMLLTPLLPSYLSEVFGADKQTIGIVLSGYTLTALMIRSLSGFLVDSFPRRIVLMTSYFLFALCFGGYLMAGSLLLFAIVRTLHGAPFGATTVANSTVAIDVLPSARRAEGIGYYGLSNNIATAISPTVALLLFDRFQSYDMLFWVALLTSLLGLWSTSQVKMRERDIQRDHRPLSLDRFILIKGWREGIAMICYAFSYGVLATYIAIYGKEELGITGGTGLFFMLLAIGLILSRLVGSRTLRQGKVTQNATVGTAISLFGYLLFAAVHNPWGYYGAALVIGLGNGHMFPAFQTMFINLAENSQRGTANSTLLVSWDIGIGLGTLVGGIVAEHVGYSAAFWTAWGVNVAGVAIYNLFVRRHFLANKLR
ncbi:MAG: MFS transporter [Alistipes sp.]|nr:MFS transporter [Alistipes sp.]MBQ5619054.1 MFS transporter [Alistipes sp.]MBQ5923471.1 MFS transporter [Alistipes sp.]